MFVQALADYADRKLQEQLNDVAFEERPIPYFLEISSDGRFLGATPRFNQTVLPGKRGGKEKVLRTSQTFLISRSPVNRNSGSHPLLAADDIAYVLGVGPWTKPEDLEKVTRHHEAFAARILRAAAETNHEALLACARFYAHPLEVGNARAALAEVPPGSYIALSVDGPVIGRAPLQAWWRKHYEDASTERASVEVAECLISGAVGPVPPTHPKIKHTAALGGQASGVSLMSFDKGAFRSYGWEQCANSPVSADRAMAYVLALNDLLKPGSAHRKDFEGVAFLFWLRDDEADGSDPFMIVVDPNPDQVKNLLDLNRPTRSLDADPDPNLFYMAAVSANGSRLILRSWVTETLPRIKANLRDWFENLRIVPLGVEQRPAPPPMWQLLQAIDREGKPPAGRVVSLIRRALEGPRRPLGYRILQDVLQRMKVEPAKRLSLPSLGLLRLCLNDLYRSMGEGELMPASLDTDKPVTHPAFVCGQLLALYDYIQWKTNSLTGEQQPSATVADRFYSLCMVSPAVGFSAVSQLGEKHLTKLRRFEARKDRTESAGLPDTDSNSSKSLASSLQYRLAALMSLLNGDFPRSFGIHDKARFALGFYQQKAFRFKKRDDPEITDSSEIQDDQEKESTL
jgi:CRISPR-associated protein Csd1